MRILRLFSLAAVAAAIVSNVSAAAFVKFDGIDGEATDKDHKQWIDVLSVSNLPAPAATAREAGSGMATGRRQHEPIRFQKRIDKASPLLAKALASKTVYPSLPLSHGGRTYTMSNARVAKVETTRTTEEITITYQEVKVSGATPKRAAGALSAQPSGSAPQSSRLTPKEAASGNP